MSFAGVSWFSIALVELFVHPRTFTNHSKRVPNSMVKVILWVQCPEDQAHHGRDLQYMSFQNAKV
jgi:hypothetical protein|tara:strand:+ start:115 stop:309 length:195 start_codon:yes stop_codon:yes gene_type:complete